jgi:hypothetical protein
MSEDRAENGQFTAAEPLTGQAGIEADLGYTRMPEDEAPPEAKSDIRAEVEKLQASRVPADDPVVPIEYARIATGEKIPLNETISLEKAATDLSTYHAQQAEEARRTDDADIARYVDGLRAEALEANPEIAKELGLSKEEVAAAKAATDEPKQDATADTQKSTAAAQEASDDPYADVEGLEPETREALKKPQIREAIEREINKAAETQQAYSAGLQSAQQFGQAALLALAPELAQVPLERWGEGIQILARSDPARAQQISQMLGNVAAINERQQLVTHYEQSRGITSSKPCGSNTASRVIRFSVR